MPFEQVTDETLATALYLETEHLDNQKIAVASGIALAINGSDT